MRRNVHRTPRMWHAAWSRCTRCTREPHRVLRVREKRRPLRRGPGSRADHDRCVAVIAVRHGSGELGVLQRQVRVGRCRDNAGYARRVSPALSRSPSMRCEQHTRGDVSGVRERVATHALNGPRPDTHPQGLHRHARTHTPTLRHALPGPSWTGSYEEVSLPMPLRRGPSPRLNEPSPKPVRFRDPPDDLG
jgi:hypothetical protein